MVFPRIRQIPKSARLLMSPLQYLLTGIMLATLVTYGVLIGLKSLLTFVLGAVTLFYAVFVLQRLVLNGFGAGQERKLNRVVPLSSDDPTLPSYTILVPLYREMEILPQLVASVSALDYPKDRLQVLLLMERDDLETIEAAAAMVLPSYISVVVVPEGGPRTKPKACNYGFLVSSGEHIVIFDAEDRPESDQLLMAVSRLRQAQTSGRRLGCVQVPLEFDNPSASLVSAFYWAEYISHYRRTLPGLDRLNLPIPLGGTSNHFLREALMAAGNTGEQLVVVGADGDEVVMQGPWDPYNVTEDADLTLRLEAEGYSVGMVSSRTFEAAPTRLRVALKQRSRWLKGYVQTGLVHLRHPLRTIRRVGLLRWLSFNLLMLGTPLALVLNPTVWGLTLTFFIAKLTGNEVVTGYIEQLFPGPVYYVAVLVAVGGNFCLFIQKLLTALQLERYELVGRLLLTPFWWAATSLAAYRGVMELLHPKFRHYWAKTPHVLNNGDALTLDGASQA